MPSSQPQDLAPGLTRARVLVQVAWQNTVLHVATVRAGGSFCLGEGRGDFPVPAAAMVGRHQPLVVHRRRQPRLVVPARARGSVSRRGRPAQPFEDLRPAATFRSIFADAVEVELDDGASAQLELGELTVEVSCGRTERMPSRISGWHWDRQLAACLAGSALATLLLLLVCRQVFPPLGDDLGGDEALLDIRQQPMFHEVQATHVDTIEPAPVFMTEPGESEVGEAYGCRCHEAQMGMPEVADDSGRYGVMGPRDNPDPHLSRYNGHHDYPSCILIGWTAPWPSSRDTPTAPWGRDDALGVDPDRARGRAWGKTIAAARGAAGHGQRVRGGLAKEIVSTATETVSQRQPARVLHAGLRTAGPVPQLEILTTVASRFSQLSRCYADRITEVPDLSGRVDLGFVIRPDGTIADLAASEQSVPDEALTACLIGALDGLTFATRAPRSTAVRYPLFLQPAAGPDRLDDPTPHGDEQLAALSRAVPDGEAS